MEGAFERVYTVVEWYDGPRTGIADFGGVPHAYQSVFREDLGDWDPQGRCRLAPVSADVLALALEEWAIWCRWEDARHAGNAAEETHPALPADAARHREIAPVVAAAMRIDPARCRLACAEFRPVRAGTSWSRREFAVRWTPAPTAGQS